MCGAEGGGGIQDKSSTDGTGFTLSGDKWAEIRETSALWTYAFSYTSLLQCIMQVINISGMRSTPARAERQQ